MLLLDQAFARDRDCDRVIGFCERWAVPAV
jgi:hypothetical protein